MTKNFNVDSELYETIKKMIPDRRIRFQLDQQFNKFKKSIRIVWKKHDHRYQG